MYYCVFDTNFLLSKGPDALRTYRVETLHHGFALASAGLPQDIACSVLMHAVLEAFLDLSQRRDLVPTKTIIWVKGTQKTPLVMRLVTTPGLPCPFLVRNLEEVGCPKAWEECYGAISEVVPNRSLQRPKYCYFKCNSFDNFNSIFPSVKIQHSSDIIL